MDEKDFLARLKNTGRNDDCPCGSGKKYKKCHLAKDELAQQKETQRLKDTAAVHEHAESDDEKRPGTPTHADPDVKPKFKPSPTVTRHNAPRRQAGM